MKNLLVLTIAVILLIPLAGKALAAPLTEPTANLRRLQIKGTMQSTEAYDLKFVTMAVNANGSGTATQIGPFTISYQGKVDFSDLSTTESARLTSSNGDRIDLTGVGQATQSATPSIFNIVQIYKIAGGSGQYADARGTITLNRIINIASGLTSSTFEGYILVP